MPNYTATTNGCKLCTPLGAAIAFRGVEGCVPFLHGSQGCATYMRRYIISHFNEPIDIASSSLGEKNAIYGGGPNLKLGLKNVTEKYNPEFIGLATTCLTETIGDNVPMIVKEYISEYQADGGPRIIDVSTPSYSGTHMQGFHGAVTAIVQQLAQKCEPLAGVNLLPGFVSPADIRHLRDIFQDFKLPVTILPDYSDTLDGPALRDYPLIPKGGTPLSEISRMGDRAATIEFGYTLGDKTGGTVLQQQSDVRLERIGLPIGIRETDSFFALLEELSGQTVPDRYNHARGRLVDAMVDGHKYIFGKKAVVYGEEDLVIGLTSFLAEIGIHPVLCGSGGKSGKMADSIARVLEGIDCPRPEVRENIDFYEIEGRTAELGADLLVGHSKGYSISRKLNIPIIRLGFPIHDRVGGQRILHLGYEGAQRLFDEITNSLIEKKQNDSPVGYSYM